MHFKDLVFPTLVAILRWNCFSLESFISEIHLLFQEAISFIKCFHNFHQKENYHIKKSLFNKLAEVFQQVVSEKTLLRQLQKEVARLEGELRSPELSSSSCLRSLLAEKELRIRQVQSSLLGFNFHVKYE